MNHHQTAPVTDLESVLRADGSARLLARAAIDSLGSEACLGVA
jgi:hypothetical protein